MRSRWLLLVAAVWLSGTVMAGCDQGGSPTVDTSGAGTTTTSAAAAATTPTLADEVDTGAPFEAKAVSAAGESYGLLTDVRVARHPSFVRVVFEFDEAVPGYRIDYAERPITQDGSGDEVTVAGTHALLVHMEPASGFDMEASTLSYDGPRRIDSGSEEAPEAVFVGDFEASLEWVVGLRGRLPYRVMTLSAPARLVVDVEVDA